MKKILILHPDLSTNGGAENFCARLIHLLQKKYEVTLLQVKHDVDLNQIKRSHGIELKPFKIIQAGFFSKLVSKLKRSSLLKYALVLRYAQTIAFHYDLVIGSYGECPLEHPCVIQCIHAPLFVTEKEVFSYLGLYEPSGLMLKARTLYAKMCQSIARWSLTRVKDIPTITNSLWTKGIADQIYGLRHSICIYAGLKEPSLDHRQILPFSSRENNFVMLGRMQKNKRLELGIQIIDQLRNKGYAVELHIIGHLSGNYENELRTFIGSRTYVHLHPNLPKIEVETLISKNKYGLHAYEFEHFGLAPAEMQKLGCVVFVPQAGGQVEIITNPHLQYRNIDEAVAKIESFFKDEALQQHILHDVEESKKRFSIEAFNENIVFFVEEVLLGTPPSSSDKPFQISRIS